MKNKFAPIGIAVMGAAVLLALIQWIAVIQGTPISGAFEFLQSWVLITGAVFLVGFIAIRQSKGFADFLRTFFTSRWNLPIPATVLAYLSSSWFAGFHDKYNIAAWHSGLALKGFWLGTIAQSHPSVTNPFPNVHYSFWVNLLQWMVDHTVYSWFGYAVIAGELFIAISFVAVVLAVVNRSFVAVAALGTVAALLFHFWFLMSGSAGVNALMPYLTGIAAVCLIGSWVAEHASQTKPTTTIVLEPIAVASETVTANGKSHEPVLTR